MGAQSIYDNLSLSELCGMLVQAAALWMMRVRIFPIVSTLNAFVTSNALISGSRPRHNGFLLAHCT